MSELASDQGFLVNEEVAHREVEGQLLLLLPDDYSLYTLNESGKLVWTELVEGRPLGEIVASLARRFGIPEAQAREDVLRLLGDLLGRGVVRPA